MKISNVVAFSPSFKKIIPVDSLVIGKKDLNDDKGQGLFDFEAQSFQDRKTVQKAVWALNRILTKEDDAKNPNNAVKNHLIRRAFQNVVNPQNSNYEYQEPWCPATKDDAMLCVAYPRNSEKILLLTGQDAIVHKELGRAIGMRKKFYYEDGDSYAYVDAAQNDFKYRNAELSHNLQNRLKDKDRANLSLKIYADLPEKAKNITSNNLNITDIEFVRK